MTPGADDVKTSRPYDGAGRRHHADQMRARTVVRARQLFLDDGYAATTVAAVAAAAGVSQRSLYLAFGGKSGLVKAIWQAGLAGDGETPAPVRSDELSAGDLTPQALIRGWATLSTEVAPQVAPVVLLVRVAAATDLDMSGLLGEINDERLQRMRHNARRLAASGNLRDDLTIDRAGEIMFAYTSPELYEILVIRQRWSLDQYGDFLERGLAAELLDPGGRRENPCHRSSGSAGAYAGEASRPDELGVIRPAAG
jgi:AcrR family transcriptional regulator